MRKTYTVSELNQYIKNLITNDLFLSAVYVSGEISNLKLHSSSHIYFTLKDDNSSVKAVMFSNYTRTLKFIPKDGMKVILFGFVNVYEKAGQYQIAVSSMVPDGVGELYLAFEQLKEKLRLKGYFSEDRKKQIPGFPEKVAIITSASGAALKDFLNIAKRRSGGVVVHLYDTLVQGNEAAGSISKCIDRANLKGEADVIVLARGGGSIEDLWAFNEEIVANALYRSKIPVVTGIGHETDFTIADMTADLRAPTPSAAAELVFPDMFSVKMNITGMREKALMLMRSKVEQHSAGLEELLHKAVLRNPEIMLGRYKMDLDNTMHKIGSSISVRIKFEKQKLLNMISVLYGSNPLNILKKGFSYTTDDKGKNIGSVEQLMPGSKIDVRFYDGSCRADVIDVTFERKNVDG
jgi:exodeoxyribonuclease VII large subunit